MLLEIDSLPETAAEAIALGDTISGESIDHQGDIDTYALPVTGGATISIVWTVAPQCSGDFPNFRIRVFEGGAALHQSFSTSYLQPTSATFTPTTTGVVYVRVEGFDFENTNCGIGGYQLVLKTP